MRPQNRIAFDACFYAMAMLFGLMRLGVRLRPSQWKRPWTVPSIVGECLVAFTLVIATTVIGSDIWVQQKTLDYDNHPSKIFEYLDATIKGMKISFYTEFAYFLVMWSVKGAFMCIYFDMAKRLPNRTRVYLQILSGVLVVTFISVIPVLIWWCRPINRIWYGEPNSLAGQTTSPTSPKKALSHAPNRSLGDDVCSPQASLFVATWTSALHILTDLAVLGMPILIIYRLQLSRADRLGVAAVLAVGSLTTLVAVVSYVVQVQLFVSWNDAASTTEIVETRVERVYLVAIAECVCAIIVVCLPSLRVLWRSAKMHTSKLSYPSATASFHKRGLSADSAMGGPRESQERLGGIEEELTEIEARRPSEV